MSIPVVSVVGRSGSGKTTLLCKIIPELKKRGFRVATIKHAAHGFDLDAPGKDTWLHANSGADIVVVSSAQKVAMLEKVEKEPALEEIINKITGVDIILIEGYKRNPYPKIEVFRRAVHDKPLCGKEDNLLAIAGDIETDLGVPVYNPDDHEALAELIMETLSKS